MRIDSAIIEASIARAKRNKLGPQELKTKIGEGDRSSHTTPRLRERRYRQLLAETGDQSSAHQALERMLEGNDLTPINYLAKGLNAARPVCRIHLKNSVGETVGFGTGFLVAPGVLMTNHHVISGVGNAKGALAEFDYELDTYGKEKPLTVFSILTNPPPIAVRHLDFCLVGISSKSDDERRNLSDFGWLPLNPDPGKATIGEYLTIIQHPSGERKQICVRENKLLRFDSGGDTLWYATDTVAGSSGSPVFNNSWQVVALHHSGVPKIDAQGHWLTADGMPWDRSMDESRIAWIANEGIRISRILAYLSANLGEHPLAKAVLAQPVSPILSVEKQSIASDRQHSEYVDGDLRVTIPVQISVRIGERLKEDIGDSTVFATSVQPMGITNVTSAIEKVDVDQSNYQDRPGFNPDFLGSDTLRVPLPEVKDVMLKREVLPFTYKGVRGTEVKYWNYSVIMHKNRKLAIYSAVNVDSNQRPEGAGRDGDRWYSDPRIGEEYEIDARFYKEQSTFEADRSMNPFDRGHLTRRLDAQWGESEEIAKRRGDDSFHWTNCSPQHWQLNQGKKRWLGLEDYVIKTFAKDSGRACVINGPVFDAPLSRQGSDGGMVPDLQGKPHKDPIFGDVAIPKLFFKVVVCKGENGLRVAAFLMSQEDFLRTMDRLKGMPPLQDEILTPAEARLYQIKVTDLEALTGLDFGPLSSAEATVEERAVIPTARIIENFGDIQV